MARSLYPSVQVPASNPGDQVAVYTNESLTVLADVSLGPGGPSLSGSEVTVTADSTTPYLYGPDGWGSKLYVSSGGEAVELTAVSAGTPAGSLPSPTTGDGGKVVTVNDAETGYELAAPSGGTSVAGAPTVRAFPFAFDTPGILTGHTIYTPTIGDILLDVWVEVTEAFDGTTPKGDVGNFQGTAQGFFTYDGSGPIDLTNYDGDSVGAGIVGVNQPSDLHMATSGTNRQMPAKFTAAHPIKVVVSDDGLNTGGDPGATQGAGVVYLVTATPAQPA